MVQGRAWRQAAASDDPAPRIAAGAARNAARLLRPSRGEARRKRLFPPGDKEARHAAKSAQHLPSHGAYPAGRSHVVGGGGPAGRGAARRGQDAEASASEENRGVSLKIRPSRDRWQTPSGKKKLSEQQFVRRA